MARKARTAATMLVLIGIVVAGAYFGWIGFTRGSFGDGEATAEDNPEPACTTPPPVTVRAGKVRVSVYNAGAPQGQATALMGALGRQGFVQGELTDAPDPIEVRGIVLWPGKADEGAVRLVRQQFDRARVARKRKSLGPGVNVLIGEQFTGLARNAPRKIEIPRPDKCPPTGSDGG